MQSMTSYKKYFHIFIFYLVINYTLIGFFINWLPSKIMEIGLPLLVPVTLSGTQHFK